MSISLIPHTYHDGDTVLTGHLGKPEGTPRGLIIVYPNIANMNAAVAARAASLPVTAIWCWSPISMASR
jgi:hypothetical protein